MSIYVCKSRNYLILSYSLVCYNGKQIATNLQHGRGLNLMQSLLDKIKLEDTFTINEEDEQESEELYYKLWEDDRL
jgi:hypothetical protein